MEKKKDYLEGYLAFLCINARNKKVKDKLLDSIKRKMSNVKGSEQEIPIFPISGAGFWNLKTANGKASSGFPTERYTGIPALSQWIRNATIPARKRHARELLSRLNVVLSVLWTWCGQMDGPDGSLGLPANALRDMCTDFKNVLRKVCVSRRPSGLDYLLTTVESRRLRCQLDRSSADVQPDQHDQSKAVQAEMQTGYPGSGFQVESALSQGAGQPEDVLGDSCSHHPPIWKCLFEHWSIQDEIFLDG